MCVAQARFGQAGPCGSLRVHLLPCWEPWAHPDLRHPAVGLGERQSRAGGVCSGQGAGFGRKMKLDVNAPTQARRPLSLVAFG